MGLKITDVDFQQHGVRLPSRPNQPCWYLVAVSVGCRPWAGHEGDVFIRLIGECFQAFFC